MELDTSLDKYLWETAASMMYQQEDMDELTPWDLWNTQLDHEQSPRDCSELEVWSPILPLMDGLVPEVDKEEVVNEVECWEEMPLKLECWEQEEWELEEKPDFKNPLLKDTFIGYREEDSCLYHTHTIPLAPHWPRSVVFVGSEGSSQISSHNTSTSGNYIHHAHDIHYHHQQVFHESNWQQEQHIVQSTNKNNWLELLPNCTPSPSSYCAQNNQFEPSSVYLPPNNEFEQLLSIGEDMAGPSQISYHHQQQQSQASLFEPLSAPESIYSSSSDSSWNQKDSYTSDSLSQDEILQEIHRECAQIEERNSSASPPLQPSSFSKARVGKTSRRVNREPYAVQSSCKNKKNATSVKASVSPQNNMLMDSPVSGEEKKRELNRIAATKYREKKRLEKESAILELRSLEDKNTKLRTQCSAMEAEIKYLKGLIKEIETRTASSRQKAN